MPYHPASAREQKVQCVTHRIHRSIQIFPLAFDLDVGFIHSPRIVRGAQMGSNSFVQFWRVLLHPSVDCGMIHVHPWLCHHLFQIPINQGIATVPNLGACGRVFSVTQLVIESSSKQQDMQEMILAGKERSPTLLFKDKDLYQQVLEQRDLHLTCMLLTAEVSAAILTDEKPGDTPAPSSVPFPG